MLHSDKFLTVLKIAVFIDLSEARAVSPRIAAIDIFAEGRKNNCLG
jgi:hypothetical protein